MITPARVPFNECEGESRLLWTTARCNRLLRPIESRLAKLALQRRVEKTKKVQLLDQVTTILDTSKYRNSDKDECVEGKDDEDKENQGGEHDDNDPDWIRSTPLEARRRRMRKKYAKKPLGSSAESARILQPNKEQQKDDAKAGVISMSTPFMTRQFKDDSALLQWTHLKAEALEKSRSTRLKQLGGKYRKALQKNEDSIMQNLQEAYINLLCATENHSRLIGKYGTRSLFSTCLRKVPAYVALEEAAQREETNNSWVTVSGEIYDDLVQMGTDEKSWSQLRVVVRAHGLYLLESAIRNSIIHDVFIEEFLFRNRQALTDNEAQSILLAWTSTQDSLPLPTSLKSRLFFLQTSKCLSPLSVSAHYGFGWDFAYTQLTVMLASDRLPLEWLSTRHMVRIWSMVIQSISSDHEHSDSASTLVKTALLKCCGLDPVQALSSTNIFSHCALSSQLSSSPSLVVQPQYQAALDNTISSLAAIIFATARTSKTFQDTLISSLETTLLRWPMAWFLEDLLLDLALAIRQQMGNGRELSASQESYVAKLLLCGLLHLGSRKQDLDFRRSKKLSMLIDTFMVSGAYKALDTQTEFLNSLSRCCTRTTGTFTDGSEQLQELENVLITVSETAPEDFGLCLRRLALNVTLKSERHGGPPAEANVKQEKLKKRKLDAATVGSDQPPPANTGYRWEEGLSEWIPMTPVASRKRARVTARIRSRADELLSCKSAFPKELTNPACSPPNIDTRDIEADQGNVTGGPGEGAEVGVLHGRSSHLRRRVDRLCRGSRDGANSRNVRARRSNSGDSTNSTSATSTSRTESSGSEVYPREEPVPTSLRRFGVDEKLVPDELLEILSGSDIEEFEDSQLEYYMRSFNFKPPFGATNHTPYHRRMRIRNPDGSTGEIVAPPRTLSSLAAMIALAIPKDEQASALHEVGSEDELI